MTTKYWSYTAKHSTEKITLGQVCKELWKNIKIVK
jgi:hypothetical protein